MLRTERVEVIINRKDPRPLRALHTNSLERNVRGSEFSEIVIEMVSGILLKLIWIMGLTGVLIIKRMAPAIVMRFWEELHVIVLMKLTLIILQALILMEIIGVIVVGIPFAVLIPGIPAQILMVLRAMVLGIKMKVWKGI